MNMRQPLRNSRLRRGAILLGFVLWCAGFVSACDDTPPLPKLAPDAVILAFGDSLTFGTGATAAQSYPAQLQGLLQRKVINAGVPGETSAGGLRRLAQWLDEHRPDLLILCHGGNDILRRLPRAAMQRNLDAMIRLAQQRDIAVVLIAVPDFSLWLRPAEVYGELAASHRIPVESQILPAILGDAALRADQVHPNAAGYRRLAKAIVDLLKKSAAL